MSSWLQRIKIAKYLNDHSSFCLYCYGDLTPQNITRNPKHIYPVGIMYLCPCKKSRIWTNSIRNEDALIEFFNGKTSYYMQGFCNDLFCGYTFDYIECLKNGIEVPGYRERFDLFGNPSHPVNKRIAFKNFADDSGSKNIEKWYKEHLGELERFLLAT